MDEAVGTKVIDTNGSGDDIPEIKTYKRRWFILLIFSMNALASTVLFSSTSPINNIVCRYYNVKATIIDWTANCFSITCIILALPAAHCMTSYGIRPLILIGSSFNAIAACLHFAAVNRDGIYFLMAGQVIGSFAFGPYMQIPVRLSTVWFPLHEHAKATGIALTANVFGVGIGYIMSTQMVPDSNNLIEVGDGLFNLYLTQMIFMVISLLMAYLFLDEKPPIPPSYSAAVTTHPGDNEAVLPLFQSIKLLVADNNVMLANQVFGLSFGLYTFSVTCLNQMVKKAVTVSVIGWMGLANDVFGILGILIVGVVMDKYKAFKRSALVLTFFTVAAWIAYTFVLVYTKSEAGLFISYTVLGLFGVPILVVGMEFVAELTYPVPEGISSAFIMIFGNVYAFVLILGLGAYVDKGNVTIACFIGIGLYALPFLFLCGCKEKLKRHQLENEQLAKTSANA